MYDNVLECLKSLHPLEINRYLWMKRCLEFASKQSELRGRG